jgi:predicted RNase H-like HicB family nuclease
VISYIAILAPEAEGGFSIFFPDLPGCATQAEDMDEAQTMAGDALSLWMEAAEDAAMKIPKARTLEEIKADKAWAKENEVDWRDATAVLIPVRPRLGRPKNVNVSLDSNKLRAIDAYAERRGMTRSAVLEAGAEILMTTDPLPSRGKQRASRKIVARVVVESDMRGNRHLPPGSSPAQRRR